MRDYRTSTGRFIKGTLGYTAYGLAVVTSTAALSLYMLPILAPGLQTLLIISAIVSALATIIMSVCATTSKQRVLPVPSWLPVLDLVYHQLQLFMVLQLNMGGWLVIAYLATVVAMTAGMWAYANQYMIIKNAGTTALGMTAVWAIIGFIGMGLTINCFPAMQTTTIIYGAGIVYFS